MRASIILTGDINLMGVEDPAVPFRRVAETLRKADAVFGNLECCLYDPPVPRVMMPDEISGYEGFFAPTATGRRSCTADFTASATPTTRTTAPSDHVIERLSRQARHPACRHGLDRTAARAPAIVTRNGTRFGFLQRTSQYWPNNHEAGEKHPGVAVIKAYTAYQPVYYKDGTLPPNRPGTPPKILTWCDRDYLERFRQDVTALKAQADIVVSSHHMGHRGEILDFQSEIAHAAIDAGADVVMAHAEHYPLASRSTRPSRSITASAAFASSRATNASSKAGSG